MYDNKKKPPNFILEEYFNGKVTAVGQFKNYIIKNNIEYLQADFFGSFKKNTVTIKETYKSNIKKTEKRIWSFNKIKENQYVGIEKNVNGLIFAKSELNTFSMKYKFFIKFKKKFKVSLTVSDKMYLYHNGLLINRSVIKKLGLTIGEIIMIYEKKY